MINEVKIKLKKGYLEYEESGGKEMEIKEY